MTRYVLAALVLLAPTISHAQLNIPPKPVDLSPATTAAAAAQSKADAAQAKADAAQARADAAIASIPVRATTLPPSEKTVPTLGTSMAYRGADDPQPRITRTASCTIVIGGGIGSCETPWDGSAFPAGTVVRLAGAPGVTTASVGAANEQPVTCKVYNMTVTGLGFRCWQAQSAVLNLSVVTTGLTLLPFAAPSTTVTVNITALPTS